MLSIGSNGTGSLSGIACERPLKDVVGGKISYIQSYDRETKQSCHGSDGFLVDTAAGMAVSCIDKVIVKVLQMVVRNHCSMHCRL